MITEAAKRLDELAKTYNRLEKERAALPSTKTNGGKTPKERTADARIAHCFSEIGTLQALILKSQARNMKELYAQLCVLYGELCINLDDYRGTIEADTDATPKQVAHATESADNCQYGLLSALEFLTRQGCQYPSARFADFHGIHIENLPFADAKNVVPLRIKRL